MDLAEHGQQFGPEQARTLTDQIKVAVEGVWHLIERAYTERAWLVLGYGSWDDYCQREFGTSRLRLPREERPEVVASLRESGLSIRAIATAARISVNTVQRDLQVSHIDTPDAAEAPEGRVTGTDGKAYAPTRPAATPRPRTDIPRTVNSALIQIDSARRALEALTGTQVAHQSGEARRAWAANLSESLEALAGFAAILTTKEQA